MFLSVIVLVTLQSLKCWAQLIGLTGPVLTSSPTVTSYFLTELTVTFTKHTPCFVTSGTVSQCGQRRGIEEVPNYYLHRYWPGEEAAINRQYRQIVLSPSRVAAVEVTAAPSSDSFDRLPFQSRSVSSSLNEDPEDYLRLSLTFENFFQRLVTDTIMFASFDGSCAGSTVDFVGFLSCLGLMSNAVAQQTVTITETILTKTVTKSAGYTTILTMAGCTPLGFPLFSCPASAAFLSNSAATAVQQDSTNINNSSTTKNSTTNNSTTNNSTSIDVADNPSPSVVS